MLEPQAPESMGLKQDPGTGPGEGACRCIPGILTLTIRDFGRSCCSGPWIVTLTSSNFGQALRRKKASPTQVLYRSNIDSYVCRFHYLFSDINVFILFLFFLGRRQNTR